MCGDRRVLWVKGLWSRIRWDGTGAPWDHTTPKCPLCPPHHGTTVHKRLIHCMRWKVAFRNMWLSTRGPWQDMVTEWWNRASAVDLHHVSCLRIPGSVWARTTTTPYMVYANCTANSPCPPATHRCRPRRPQRCRHGTRSCAHEPYGLTPRTLSSAIK